MVNKVLFHFRNNNLKQVLNDLHDSPREFMFGAYELLLKYPQIHYCNSLRGVRNTLLRKALYPFEKAFTIFIKLGMPIEIVIENWKAVQKSRKIFCNNDAISFAYLFWKTLGCIKADIFTLFQSLTERKTKYFSGNLLAIAIIRAMLKQSKKVFVLSSAAKDEMHQTFLVPLEKIKVLYFGADLSFWNYKEFSIDNRDYILSIGNDMNRDYLTLIKALAGKYKVIIITKQQINDSRIIVKSGLTNHEIKQLYQSARLTVIPSTGSMTESSGLSTTVQSMACGTPVLVSDSPPLRELFSENSEVLYFEPENPQALAEKVNSCWDNNVFLSDISIKARKLIEKRFNSYRMSEFLEKELGLLKE